jgi:hypothetical protein
MFGKLKQAFGIGTINVNLEIPAAIEKSTHEVIGTLHLAAQSDQQVQNISIRLLEMYSTGRGAEKKTREYELGQIKLSEAFEMHSGEVKDIAFTLPYKLIKSNNDDLKGYGGAIGALGKLSSMVDAEKSEYQVRAVVAVKGAAFSPLDHKHIKLV